MDTVQLIINGKEEDFVAFLGDIVSKAVQSAMPRWTPEFTIEPEKNYRLSDERIQRLFGVDNLQHPVKSILYALRKHGISPRNTTRHGSTVRGSQINEYFAAVNADTFRQSIKNN